MRFLYLIIILFAPNFIFSQDGDVWLHPNRGQWHENIQYKVALNGGEMYLENQGFTYAFHNAAEVYHKSHDESNEHRDEVVLKGHAIRSVFIGASANVRMTEGARSESFRNYFLGNDPSKWKSSVYSTSKVIYENLYPSVQMEVESKNDGLKYSFIVSPGQNPSLIQMKIDGALKVFIDHSGNLHTQHPFGEIVESAPVAWTLDENGSKKEVTVRFELSNNILSYAFPEAYDHSQKLIIDPQLTFSTFTGSTADNWGFTAAPDAHANVFAAGIVFATGYPTTTGAYDPTYNGGLFDIGLTKFSANGSSLIYSTYLGGTFTETPHSIVCNANNELYVMGVTSSTNFPMKGSPYNSNFRGGPTFTENGLTFNGADLFVAKMSADGGQLLASTYVGGSGTDGINRGALHFNYGDQFRGDITLDKQGNVYVASSTTSLDFPVVNAMQTSLKGTQDAVIFKMEPNLSTMLWSTYFGGTGNETGNSIQVASNGNVYVAGGSTSSTFQSPQGVNVGGLGGLSDGYVIRVNGTSPNLLSGTFIGTNEYDQAYFVQLDLDDKVYVYGQTEGLMSITSGLYGTPNSGQFIKKFNKELTINEWTTTIGAGSGHAEISPTAFLVSDCYDIYISGWGGLVNRGNSSAVHSSSNGFQVTPDAFQANSTGNNFYIAVLGPNAATLKYGTYMGGITSSSNHVDGGTSRFDKSGRIYHAVCGACQGNANGFTTTPGVWSPTNRSSNCNLAAFKFELNKIDAVVSQPASVICLPSPVIFDNNSANGNSFHWNFGDNTTSTQVNPSHVYPGPGTYNVTLVVSDSSNCFSSDTTQFTVTVAVFNGQLIASDSAVCPGVPVQLTASGGTGYQWFPANVLNDPTIANPIATINETTDFSVVITGVCGADTLPLTITILGGSITVTNDTVICLGNSMPLSATGGITYEWVPATYLNNPNIANPVSTPLGTITYRVKVTIPEGCVLEKSVKIEVDTIMPDPVISDTVGICYGDSRQITVSGARYYDWSPPVNITPLVGPTVTVNPTTDIHYYCAFSNACGVVVDSVFVKILKANIRAGNDTIICPGEIALLHASGGVSYVWSPSGSLNQNYGDHVIALPLQNTIYKVVGTDLNGCRDSATVIVERYPTPYIQTIPDVYAFYGDHIQLGTTTSPPGVYTWDPAEYLSCVVCQTPTGSPNRNSQYTVTYTDVNGCKATDAIRIFYDPTLYVPNTFTPNGDDFNDFFRAIGGNISEFEMDIYNRWGELIRTLRNLDESWDGTYKDLPSPDGTYVWKIRYKGMESEAVYVLEGHVNLLR